MQGLSGRPKGPSDRSAEKPLFIRKKICGCGDKGFGAINFSGIIPTPPPRFGKVPMFAGLLLAVIVELAHRLQVCAIPEQSWIATVRLYKIHHKTNLHNSRDALNVPSRARFRSIKEEPGNAGRSDVDQTRTPQVLGINEGRIGRRSEGLRSWPRKPWRTARNSAVPIICTCGLTFSAIALQLEPSGSTCSLAIPDLVSGAQPR